MASPQLNYDFESMDLKEHFTGFYEAILVDPRITTETYGHLQPDYLRSEIDRLRFNTEPANDLSSGSQPSAALSPNLLTRTSIRVLSPVGRGRLSRRESRAYSCGVDGT